MSPIPSPNSAAASDPILLSDSETDLRHDSQTDEKETFPKPSLNPVQFSIAELFWVSLAVAIVLAIATPFLRQLPQAAFNSAILVLVIQSIAIVSLAGFVSHRRKRVLRSSGNLIAVGSSSESPSEKWAIFFSFFSIFMTFVMQFYISIGLCFAFSTKIWSSGYMTFVTIAIVIGQSLGPMIFLTHSIRFLRWRIRSDAVEFFENGVAILDALTPWSQIELRRSEFHQNRVMVYYPEQQTSIMVWLDKSEVDRLMLLGRAHGASSA